MSDVAALADYNDLEALSILSRYRDWIISRFVPYLSGDVVEYGAGIGNVSSHLLPYAAKLDLVEPLAPLARRLSDKFAAEPRVRISQTTTEKSVSETDGGSYDAVVMVNVLEHISDDRHILGELHRVLRNGGHLCLFVPAHAWLYSKYDGIVGHHRRYKLSDLRNLVEGAGFEVVDSRYFDILGVVPWLLAMRMMGRTAISPTLGYVYDRLVVPVGRVIETFFSLPLGKNIILVARK